MRAETAAELVALGPYFALDLVDGDGDPAPPWEPLSRLIADPRLLDARVAAVGSALGRLRPGDAAVVPPRVGASVAQLGIAARLLAPAVGARALGCGWPALTLDDVWWQDVLGGPFPIAARPGEPVVHPLAGSAVEALTLLAIDRYRLGPRVAWGNVASAANGAALMIARAVPGYAELACRAADEILADPRVEGGQLRAGTGFRRRSCCLIYRVAGRRDAVCGDCVLPTGAG